MSEPVIPKSPNPLPEKQFIQTAPQTVINKDLKPSQAQIAVPLVVRSVLGEIIKPNLIKQAPRLFNITAVDGETVAQESEKQSDVSSEDLSVGRLGLPVYDTLEISPFDYTDQNGNTISFDGALFQEVIIEVNQPKNIIKTIIQGRDKSVKEYINEGDYSIRIKGCLVGKYANRIPVDELNQLIQLKKVPQEVAVNSVFLSYFEINSIVIEDVKFMQREGMRNVVDIVIDAVDEVPFEIKSNA